MKTVLDQATREELIARINTLTENSQPQWGKMSVYQMLKHGTLVDEMYMGAKPYKRVFIGYLFGKMALKKMLKDESQIDKNMPTMPLFKVNVERGDVAAQKQKWIATISKYEHIADSGFKHAFFGPMTREQVGQLGYKHIDHHLRQFGA